MDKPESSETSHAGHSHPNYLRIYGILLILLVASIFGPTLHVLAIVLITAFGIAVVKALMVAAYFMHLNVERKYIWYLMFGCLGALGIMYSVLVWDVQHHEGTNWHNARQKPALVVNEFEPAKAETPAPASNFE